MSSPDHGWAWFERIDADRLDATDSDAADLDLARAFARCFRGEDGSRVIEHLRAVTVGRALGPAASDAQLRHTEGQRQLVAYINALIERGRGAG